MRKLDYVFIAAIIALVFIIKCGGNTKPTDVNNDWKDSVKAYNKREAARDKRQDSVDKKYVNLESRFIALESNEKTLTNQLTIIKSGKNEKLNAIRILPFTEHYLLFTRNISKIDTL